MFARSRRAAALAVAISLIAPSGVLAQTDEPGLSEEPPVQLNGDDSGSGSEKPTGGTGAPLAETGAEPLLVGFAGMGLLLVGAGLRLRLGAPHGRR